jgi:hypothetical protein
VLSFIVLSPPGDSQQMAGQVNKASDVLM